MYIRFKNTLKTLALIFSSGGGRLGNQLLNILHLNALSLEYDIEIYKISDPFIIEKNRKLIYKIEKSQEISTDE